MTTAETKMPDASTPHNPPTQTPLAPTDRFVDRHIGPDAAEIAHMLEAVGAPSLEAFVESVVPADIRFAPGEGLELGEALTERDALDELRRMSDANVVCRSCIGMGYHGTITPAVIRRNVFENPAWYTQYTPYQSEISQGRLEALLIFQTMVAELTGLPLANSSLLDEGTAAGEAMAMCVSMTRGKRDAFYVSDDCHPQTIAVVRTRAASLGIDLRVGPIDAFDAADEALAGVLVQYPTTDGRVECYEELAKRAHEHGVSVVAAADLLALTLFRSPETWGADICVGSTQRFGVPMGFGGPHAGFIATREEHARRMPGRIVGVSRDSAGNPALRLAIQTREQHIKRDRATSNICTAQVLPGILAAFYGVYHGPEGLRAIAERVRLMTGALRVGLVGLGHEIGEDLVFDTLRVRPKGMSAVDAVKSARAKRINLRDFGDGSVGITLDETSDERLVRDLLVAFGGEPRADVDALLAEWGGRELPAPFVRGDAYLTGPEFNTHRTETELLRYITELQGRDLSLANSMIPLGSCTMKLNAAAEMEPVSYFGFSNMHPYAPADQCRGYAELIERLEDQIKAITGLPAVSLQPNAGSQGEYAGLLAIRGYHASKGEAERDVCLIPDSAHGTNPASAIVAGMRVVAVKSRADGWVDLEDLKAKAAHHAGTLGALMITYPSTCGVFEDHIRAVCDVIHEHGGQVYMDGANLNAQVGLTNPAACGADVCHLNLHKTFCIPHGGGGPGMGPIAAAEHLELFMPSLDYEQDAIDPGTGMVSAAPWGSASILPISWAYIAMMGAAGLRKASSVAVLSANYMAERLSKDYNVLFHGPNGRVAHEFVIDCRPFKKSAGIEIDDIAKRLMDYGFHAPTMSWPVPGTLMIEPTESESLPELDRLCDALITIRSEITEIEQGTWPRDDNPLKNAPHTIEAVSADTWTHAYPRERAAFPADHLRRRKFWPSVGRVDNPFGDRNLACTCPSVAESAS
ncbi:MAG: glycine dehydrogenase (decarboxylating) [Phycisphaeraceae bacterium]|nr:MAG: glycine dehydrogenase (decarboxylating) [Phycisphaeraceae bacterium]